MPTVLFIKFGTTSWTPPADWPGFGKVECIAPGGNGQAGSSGTARKYGGGGGAYACRYRVDVAPGATVECRVGNGGQQADTFFVYNNTVVARHGRNGANTGNGGSTNLSVGDVVFAGGNAGTDTSGFACSGGGAAGPDGAGGAGSVGGSGSSRAVGGIANAGSSFAWVASTGERASPGNGGASGGRNSGDAQGGSLYGGGGGGGGASGSAAGAGAPGLIIVTYEPITAIRPSIRIGATPIENLMVGSTAVRSVFIGDVKV